MSLLGDQARTAPRPVAGGLPGAAAEPSFVLDGEPFTLPLVSKGENVKLQPGDTVCLRAAGGTPGNLVARDVEDGYLTAEESERD